LSEIGLTPAFADGQIAAVASTNQLILVTRNLKDFINFRDLTIENWFD
jgi:tRNA(fMet)-specific endonuclease VapC